LEEMKSAKGLENLERVKKSSEGEFVWF
jgi:hypothetical protein